MMTTAISPTILDHLQGVRAAGDGQWEARCPAHEDRRASLSVSATGDGVTLIRCHAGCSAADVVAAVGMKLSDLFPATQRNGHSNGFNVTKAYDYADESGVLLFQVCRLDPKDFCQRKPKPGGGWDWSTKGVRKVLYRLKELLDADPTQTVFIPEGEKDCDRLWSMELVATCNPGGAGKWRAEFAEHLRGRHVAIVPDNDDAGRSHAADVARSLRGVAASIRVCNLRGVPEKGDVSDWLGDDGMASDLLTLAEETPADIEGAQNYAPEDVNGNDIPDDVLAEMMGAGEPTRPEFKAPNMRMEQEPEQPPKEFAFRDAAEFDALDLRRDYHIRGILPAGPVPTVMAAAFKCMKTSIAMDLAISLAAGHRFLNHFPVTRQTRVAVMSFESGGFALQNLARRIAISKGWTFAGLEDWLFICTEAPSLSSPPDIAAIERFITERDIKVFIVDPTYLAMKNLRSDDAGSLFAMGAMLEPLLRLGERTGCTIIIVHHNTRTSMRANAGEPAELADIAWSGFAEIAGAWLLIARREKYDPDSDGEHRLWLTAGGRDGHSTLVGVNVTEGRQDSPGGRRWDVEVEAASATRREAIEAEQARKDEERRVKEQARNDSLRQRILDVLNAGPDTKSAIRDKAGVDSGRFNPILADLIRENAVEPTRITKNNTEYDGYKLRSDRSDRSDKNPESSEHPSDGIGRSDRTLIESPSDHRPTSAHVRPGEELEECPSPYPTAEDQQ